MTGRQFNTTSGASFVKQCFAPLAEDPLDWTVAPERQSSVDISVLNEILNTALSLAAAGVPVFPCKNKRPANANGFHGASCDERQIREWFATENDYQLAIRPADAGRIVIDVD